MLIVKKSNLPNAGKGLFTTTPIKKGTHVIEYIGENITWAECLKRNRDKPPLEQGVYYFFITNKNCVDAEHTPKELARYANDARGFTKIKGLKNNAEYQIHNKKALIVAIKDIQKGEEIFVSYGDDYWSVLKPLYLKKQKEQLKLEKAKLKTK